MSVSDRIDQLPARPASAIEAASTSAELEEVRVRYLGRKAELPNLLRGVAELPPQERGVVGRAANEARRALEAQLDARATELAALGARRQARAGPGRRDAPGRPRRRRRTPAPDHPHPPGDRGRVHRARLPDRGGARGRARLLQLRRAELLADAPEPARDRHLLHRAGTRPVRPRGAAAAGPHLADAGPRDGEPAASDLRDRARARLPA